MAVNKREITSGAIALEIEAALALKATIEPKQLYRELFSFIDLTRLDIRDGYSHIEEFAQGATKLQKRCGGLPSVASICVMPLFVESVGVALGTEPIAITSVAGAFPMGQTYPEVKALECAMAVENGADEIDMVIDLGAFLEGRLDEVRSEIAFIKAEIGEDITLKIILESGLYSSPSQIYNAAWIAMEGGANFVKTSTGKSEISATKEAAVVICWAIKDYYEATGLKRGFKVAGGVKTASDAVLYYSMVKHILGKEWLTADLFRIGASSLVDNLIAELER